MEEFARILIGVLGTHLNKSTEELESELIDSTGEQIKPKLNSGEVKSYFKPLLTARLDTVKELGSTEGKGEAKRLAMKEVETKIKETYGISGKMSEGLIDKVVEKVKADAQATAAKSVQGIKESKEYLELVADYEQKLKDKDVSMSELTATHSKDLVSRDLRSFAATLLKKEDSGIALPEEDVFNGRVQRLVSEILSDPSLKIARGDNDVLNALTPEGGAIYNDHNVVSLGDIIMKRAKGPYFDTIQQGQRSSTGSPVGAEGGKGGGPLSRSVKVGDNTHTIPEFKTKQDYNNFVVNAPFGTPKEVLDHAGKLAEDISE